MTILQKRSDIPGTFRVLAQGLDFATSQSFYVTPPEGIGHFIFERAAVRLDKIASSPGSLTVSEYDDVTLQPAVTATTSAAITISGGSGSLTLTCLAAGASGNSVSLVTTNPGTESATLSFSAVGSVVTASLATDAGTRQVETATAAGSVSGDGNASVVVTASGLTGSPLTIPVAVVNGDSAATWAGKVRTALSADSAIAARFTVGGSTTAISLTRLTAAANDATLNIALSTGTATGITTAATSTNTTAGVVPAITTTVALLRTGLAAYGAANQLMVIPAGSDDSQTLTAGTHTFSGGADAYRGADGATLASFPDLGDDLLQQVTTSPTVPQAGDCKIKVTINDVVPNGTCTGDVLLTFAVV